MPRAERPDPDSSWMAAFGVVLMLLGFPLQLIGHGVAAGRVLGAATESFDAASAICWELHHYNEQAWHRCLEPASEHPLDALSWPTFLFPWPGLILFSIGGWLLIRSAVGHARRERLAWRVLITAWTLHLHGWLLLWIYFSWSSDVPRWIALVAVPAGALTVILVLRVRWARIQGRRGPEATLSLADFGIASVASALTICAALLTPIGVDGVLLFGASPAGAATALAGIVGLVAAVATRSDKSPGRGP